MASKNSAPILSDGRGAEAPAAAASAAAAAPAAEALAASEQPVVDDIRSRLRERGLRWTPQRRALLDVLQATDGHVTGAELVELCRERDPETTPSTVYRTLDVLEELGIVRHSHGRDGREEFHVGPTSEHGHAICARCGSTIELEAEDVAGLATSLARRGFNVDLSHLSVGGTCAECAEAET
jgi:Fur family transcriptional regulator, ferric uptake regulator